MRVPNAKGSSHKRNPTTKRPSFRKAEKGQGLVELAVCLIIILIILAGITDLSRAILTKMSMQDAAEEGIIYGSVFPMNCAEIQQRVLDNLYKVPGIAANDIEITYDGADCLSTGDFEGKLIKISITINFPISMPFLGAAVGSPRNISVEAKGIVLYSP
jgi:hypothetical protein